MFSGMILVILAQNNGIQVFWGGFIRRFCPIIEKSQILLFGSKQPIIFSIILYNIYWRDKMFPPDLGLVLCFGNFFEDSLMK